MIRRAVLLLLFAAALSIGGVMAWAHWGATVNAGANGAAVAASVNAAATPTASLVAAQKVTLTWSAVTLSNGVPVDGYIVKRYNATTLVTQTVLAGCAGTITGTTCTESSVPVGSWRYSVYPLIATSWVGTESGLTSPLTVVNPSLTLAKQYFAGSLPNATTGTIAGFGVNEAVSYRLDAATPLTGFPTAVDTTGGAPISSLTIPLGTSEGVHTVYAVGGNGSIASTTITVDTVAPTISSSTSPTPNGAGWNNTSPVTVTLTTADATSGVNVVKYTTDGTDPSVSGTAVAYSMPFTIAATITLRYYATDNAGNASAIGSRTVQIDTVAPANSLALSSVTGAKLTGTTIYYRGMATGSFTLTNSVTDAGSGPASSSTTTLGGTSTGFTHTASTVTTPAGGPYVSNAFTWSAGTTSAPTETVTGADVAGNTAATALSFVNDSTAPSGGSVDATGLVGTGSRYSTSTSISVAFAKGTDSGVGLAATGALLQRATATLTTGTCGGYGTYATIATDPASPYGDTVSDQACYRYQYVVADLVGNSTPYIGGDVKVDTTAPSAPTLTPVAGTKTYVSGSTVYYNSSMSSGSFTVTPASTDAASGIANYTYPAFGTNWSSTAGSYSWSGVPAAPGTKSFTATNNATLTASTSLTMVDDTTAPSGGSITYTAGYLSSQSKTITFATGTDSGSGLGAGAVQRNSAPMIGGVCQTYAGWAALSAAASPVTDTTMANDTCNMYRYVISDNVGNQVVYTNANVVKAPNYYTCAQAVAANTPYLYWKLGDAAASTTAADSSGNGRTGDYNGGGFTYGLAGACLNGVTLNGANFVPQTSATGITAPTVFSYELWFKTTTTTGGRLFGIGSARTGVSLNVDRHIYLSNAGALYFGVANGLLYTVSSANATSPVVYNDGQWHQVVATQSATTQKLYVDGVQVDSAARAAPGTFANGFYRMGYDNLLLWPSAPSSYYFTGSVSNVSVYHGSALSATDVFDHFVAGVVSSTGQITAPPSISAQVAAVPASRPARPLLPPSPPPISPAIPSRPSFTSVEPKRASVSSSEPPPPLSPASRLPSMLDSGALPSF